MNTRIVDLPPPATIDLVLPSAHQASFPVQSFPVILQSVANGLSRVYQTPPSLPAMCALGVLSGAVGKSVVVSGAYKDKRTPLNLYVIPVADRGAGKGNVGDVLSAPLARRSRLLAEQHRRATISRRGELGLLKREIQRVEQQAANAEGAERANLVESLAAKHERLETLEAECRREAALWVSDTTSEALATALRDNGEALLSYSAEAGGAVKVALGKYARDGDYDLLLAAYSGDAWKTNRIGRTTVQLDRPCLSLVWLVQPTVLQRLVSDPEVMERGLTARPLLFDTGAARQHDNRATESFELAGQWSDLIDSVIDRRLSSSEACEVACTAEAREVFAQLHDRSVDLGREAYADLDGELSRWRENAIKVAGLFAVAEGERSLTAACAERAAAVVEWCGMSYFTMLNAHRYERSRRDVARLEALLFDQGGEVNMGTLAQRHGFNRPRVLALVHAFPDRLEVRIRQGTTGRPAELVTFANRVNRLNQEVGRV